MNSIMLKKLNAAVQIFQRLIKIPRTNHVHAHLSISQPFRQNPVEHYAETPAVVSNKNIQTSL